MGTEYYLLNHNNTSLYELGKGPFSTVLQDLTILKEKNKLSNKLISTWQDSFQAKTDPEKIRFYEYCSLIAQDLYNFIKDTPDESIEFINDSGEDHMFAVHLRYKCIGSRYGLGDPSENMKYIDSENSLLNREDYKFSDLSEDEIDHLKQRGWNFKNVFI
jgi:hypothetical protein